MKSNCFRRRQLLGLLGGAAATWARAAWAQQPGKIYRVGFLIPAARQSPPVRAMFDELRLEGFVEDQNLSVIGSFAKIDEQLTEQAAALVGAAPDAIVAGPELPIRTVQALTHTVPINGMTEDMVQEGLVASLARPGGNITGISLLSPELDGKRQDILIEAVPGARRIAAVGDTRVTQPYHVEMLQQGGRSRGVEVSFFGATGPEEIAQTINAAKRSGAEALNFLASPLFSLAGTRNHQIVMDAIAAVRLPAIFQWPETAEAGALMGYGPRFTEVYRMRAGQIAKILRGTKPADIPVERPSRFELVVNIKAAKAIGLDFPTGLALRADQVIE
jgi:putative ABC transport system substrate-binding protein